MMGGTALGKGRGEVLSPMLTRGEYHWCFIASAQGLSTPAVFKKLAEMREASACAGDTTLIPSLDVTDTSHALVSGDVHCLATLLRYALQPAALYQRPHLRKAMQVGLEDAALPDSVSGSGPTIAFLCEDAAPAEEVRHQVTLDIPKTRGYVASSPAPRVRIY